MKNLRVYCHCFYNQRGALTSRRVCNSGCDQYIANTGQKEPPNNILYNCPVAQTPAQNIKCVLCHPAWPKFFEPTTFKSQQSALASKELWLEADQGGREASAADHRC